MIAVALSAGHGGASTGVVKGNEWERLIEKDWVLEMALSLHDRLGLLPNVTPALTRHDDTDLGLNEDASIARDYGADLALCLHVNSYNDPKERGMRVFYWPGQTTAKLVANAVALHAPPELREMSPRPRQSSTTLWPGVNNVLAPFVAKGICAVLIEFGFASNTGDRKFLLTDPGKAGCALAAEAGVIEFWKLESEKSKHAA
jgi:N-acetylmuramoyl-L-alanine amidase